MLVLESKLFDEEVKVLLQLRKVNTVVSFISPQLHPLKADRVFASLGPAFSGRSSLKHKGGKGQKKKKEKKKRKMEKKEKEEKRKGKRKRKRRRGRKKIKRKKKKKKKKREKEKKRKRKCGPQPYVVPL